MIRVGKWITLPQEKAEVGGVSFQTGTLSTGEVVAGVMEPDREEDILPLFRKRFFLKKPLKKAALELSACGLYRLFVNGKRISYGLFDPGFTDYGSRTQIQVYDLTEILKKENLLELEAAGGWALAGLLGSGQHFFHDEICVIGELTLTYSDGSEEIIGTDSSFTVFRSQVRMSSVYNGEIIDESAEPEFLGFARETKVPTTLVPQGKAPVLEQERLPVKALLKDSSGRILVDFGQNLAGYAEIRVSGKKSDRVCLRHGEVLDGKGDLYIKNLRTAKQKMTYILGRDGENILKPHFTVQGFRYLLLEDFPGEASPERFTAVAVYTDMKRTGFFSCGNEKINRLFSCILWNQRSNFLEVPTDCPQRDERLGWLGDAQAFCRSAAFNYDVESFYRNWLIDVRSGQHADGFVPAIAPYNPKGYPFRASAAWGDAVTMIPWELYLQYGDISCLEEAFDSMRRWVEYQRSSGPEEYLWLDGSHYGDWLALDGPDPRKPKTDKDFIASAYYYHSADLLVRAGKLLGKDVSEYENLAVNIRRAFRERFLSGGLPKTDTYAASALLLTFGLLEKEENARVAAHLAGLVEENGNCLMAGVVGAPLLLHALSENGYAAKAYDLLLEEKVPSWLGMLRYGATTLWERLDTYTDEGIKDIRNASFNHCVFGAVLDWMTGCAGGLQASEKGPGYRVFTWRPLPEERLGKLSLTFESRQGTIRASWQIQGDRVSYRLLFPKGVRAEITLPGKETLEDCSGTFSAELPYIKE